MDTQSSGRLGAIERARYKLLQADMALRYLHQIPAEIAADLRRARPISDPDLRLDTFFFSCLSLAKSAYYIIKADQGGRYGDAINSWRMNVLDVKGRTQFNRMMKLRDKDVHHGQSDGKTHATMIPFERSGDDDSWMYQQQPNYAALGISRPATEHTNPDGSTVSSYDGLQGSRGLYVEIAGETCEAANACERFISQLRGLIDAVDSKPQTCHRPAHCNGFGSGSGQSSAYGTSCEGHQPAMSAIPRLKRVTHTSQLQESAWPM